MKSFVGNILIRFILSADKRLQQQMFAALNKSNQNLIYNQFRKKYDIEQSFKFNGDKIYLYGSGRIYCGKNSYIGSYSTLQSGEGCKIVIGDNCSISHNVRIYTTSNVASQNMNNPRPKLKQNGDVIIKDGVWIGANVFIKENVTLGENSVVGANSVVTKNIDPNSIYGGIPAKLLKRKNIDDN